MVLQQGENVNVWGWADANAKNDVAFAGQKVSTLADKNGAWKLVLKPLEVSSQGREMTIFENDKLARTIKDVLVGEVWVAGGQSNMAYPLAKSKGGKEIIVELGLTVVAVALIVVFRDQIKTLVDNIMGQATTTITGLFNFV